MAGIDVAALPRRTAHAVSALMQAANIMEGNGAGPFTAAEVCVYDSEAMSVRHTAAALRAGQRAGLCVYIPGGEGYWTPTNAALDQKREFEERFCDETEEFFGG
jgi:hypothetical protein